MCHQSNTARRGEARQETKWTLPATYYSVTYTCGDVRGTTGPDEKVGSRPAPNENFGCRPPLDRKSRCRQFGSMNMWMISVDPLAGFVVMRQFVSEIFGFVARSGLLPAVNMYFTLMDSMHTNLYFLIHNGHNLNINP